MSAPPSRPATPDFICTGFWANQDLRDPCFDFLEHVCTGRNSMMEYLHGECTFFALALNDLTGYPMYCLADEDELAERDYPDPSEKIFPLIHDFCVIGDIGSESNPALFVDCRGIISSEHAFLDEFRDFFTGYRLIRYAPNQIKRLRDFFWSPASKNHASRYYQEACNYIKGHSQSYMSY